MSYMRLFIDLIYHGLRARVYLWARGYVERYESKSQPVTVFGGGREWPVMDNIAKTEWLQEHFGRNWQAYWDRWDKVFNPPVDPSNLKPEDMP